MTITIVTFYSLKDFLMYFTLKMFSGKWERNIRILIKFYVFILFIMYIKLLVIWFIIKLYARNNISLFYYCHYFSLVFFFLVLFFIRWLYNDLLNFSFCKYISSHPTSICSKLVLLPGAFLFTLLISLNKFLQVEIPGTKHLM